MALKFKVLLALQLCILYVLSFDISNDIGFDYHYKMGRHLTDYEIGKVVAWRSINPPLSYNEIANRINSHKTTVYDAYQRHKYGKASSKQRKRHKTATTTRDDRHIIYHSNRNPYDSNKNIKDKLDLKCSIRTIGRRLQSAGLNSYWTIPKPFISAINRRKRLKFAHDHKKWTRWQWVNVLWSDEKKFGLRYQQRKRIRRRKGQRLNLKYLKGTIKHDKSVMVWSCFAFSGGGAFFRVHGIMDKYKYHNILQRHMIPSMNKLVNNKIGYFQQDNDPKHTSRYCQNYLKSKNINTLEWVSQSPDINPMENAWKHLDDKCKDRKCKNENELFLLLQKEWNNIDKEYFHKLVWSMPDRMAAVIKAKGGPTKY